MQWNCNGLTLSKQAIVQQALLQDNIDVLLLQEVKLPEITQRLIPGYATYGSVRGRRGGGTLIAVRSDPLFKLLPVAVAVPSILTTALEMTELRLFVGPHEQLRITNVYFPTGEVSEAALAFILTRANSTPSPHLLCGDFNCHAQDWDNYAEPDATGTNLCEWAVLNRYNVCNDPDLPTRVGHTSGAVVASSPDITLARGCLITDWQPMQTIESDHCRIFFHLPIAGLPPLPLPQSHRDRVWQPYRASLQESPCSS